MGDRLDPADPERVRHDRAGRAAPALGRDPLLLREAHQVPADEEELGEAGPLDDVELVGEPLDDRPGSAGGSAAGRPPSTARRGTRTASRPAAPGSPGSGTARSRDRPSRRPRARRRSRSPRPGRRRGGVGLATRRPGGSAASSAPDFRYDSPSGRRRSASVSSVRPWRIAVRTSWSSRSSGQRVVDVVGDDDRQAELAGEAPPSPATSQSSSGRRWCDSSRKKPARRPAPSPRPKSARVALGDRSAPRPDRRPGAAGRSRPRGSRTARRGPPRARRGAPG